MVRLPFSEFEPRAHAGLAEAVLLEALRPVLEAGHHARLEGLQLEVGDRDGEEAAEGLRVTRLRQHDLAAGTDHRVEAGEAHAAGALLDVREDRREITAVDGVLGVLQLRAGGAEALGAGGREGEAAVLVERGEGRVRHHLDDVVEGMAGLGSERLVDRRQRAVALGEIGEHLRQCQRVLHLRQLGRDLAHDLEDGGGAGGIAARDAGLPVEVELTEQ